MKHFYLPLGLFLVFLTGCTPSAPKSVDERDDSRRSARVERDDEDYERRRRDRADDRRRVMDDSRSRRSGADCAGDDDCEEMCEDIYRKRKDKEDCEELSQNQVEFLAEIYDTLEDPNDDNLDEIDLDDLKVFIGISIEPLDKLIGRYSRREARETLAWIAAKPDVALIFSKEDDDFKILDKLLDELNSDSETALKTTVESGDGFLELIVENGNEEAGNWIHDFMEEEVCGGDVETAVCLRKYCALAEDMSDDNAEDMLDFEYFQDYLDDIIGEGVNGDRWARGHKTREDGDARALENDAKCDTSSPYDDATADCEPFEDYDDIDGNWWDEEGLCSSVAG